MSVIGHSPLAGASGAAGGADPLYADDVFSTFLYDGTAATHQIVNGIDLAGEGGMVWIQTRDSSNAYPAVYDTEGGTGPNGGRIFAGFSGTSARSTQSDGLQSFNSNGVTLGTALYENGNGSIVGGSEYVLWSFRKAPGFFDVVTYTGNGTAGRTVSHSLGSTPGMIIIKSTSNTEDWQVWHRSVTGNLEINNTGALNSSSVRVTAVSSTNFTLSTFNTSNANGQTYVAYVFAHDDQSFGTDGDEAIIKCGSFTGNTASVDLGFEPQFVIFKRTDSSTAGGWHVYDTMRGFHAPDADDALLYANATNAESITSRRINLTSTGFDQTTNLYSGATYIYMAIRRPHKPPEAGTEVFAVNTRNGNETAGTLSTAGFPVDLAIISARNVGHWTVAFDRLRGPLKFLATQVTNAESTYINSLTGFDNNTAIEIGTDSQNLGVNRNSQTNVDFLFKRVPGFFDIVAYTGNASTNNVSHNLQAVPELMIFKNRDQSVGWPVWFGDGSNICRLDLTNAKFDEGLNLNATSATNIPISSGNSSYNNNNIDYIVYLFATLSGISKVGTYTGTGSSINVNCGFTAGARFVMIKRTDSAGDWYVFDTARGIVSGNDPYLRFNSTDAETTNTDYIDPLNAGFTVTSSAPAALNASGGTYLFLAIA